MGCNLCVLNKNENNEDYSYILTHLPKNKEFCDFNIIRKIPLVEELKIYKNSESYYSKIKYLIFDHDNKKIKYPKNLQSK